MQKVKLWKLWNAVSFMILMHGGNISSVEVLKKKSKGGEKMGKVDMPEYMERKEDLKKFKTVQVWLDSIASESIGGLREETEKAYLRGLNLWCGFRGLSPDELVKERVETFSLKEGETDERGRTWDYVEKKLQEFARILASKKVNKKGKTLSSKALALRITAVRSFYARNLPRMKITGKMLKGMREKKTKPIPREILRQAYLISSGMQKLALILQWQSGLRKCSLARIPLRRYSTSPLRFELDPSKAPILFTVYAKENKEPVEFEAILGRDSIETLRAFFPNPSQEQLEKPIFSSELQISGLMKRLSDKLSEKLGYKIVINNRRIRASTSLALREVMPGEAVEYLLGHAGKYEGAYTPWRRKDLRAWYQKANMDFLSQNQKIGISQLNEFSEDLARTLLTLLLQNNPKLRETLKALITKELSVEWNPLESPKPAIVVLQEVAKELLS